MATTDSAVDGQLENLGWSGDVVGGALITVLGLLHLFGLQLGGWLGFVLLLGVWPMLGGAVAARVGRRRGGKDWGTASAVAGVFGAAAVTVVMFLTGVAGVWSGFVTTAFGVTLWSTVFAVFVLFMLTWTVFSYAGGFVEQQVAGADRTVADAADDE
jgi:hypothetical protein